MKMGKAYEIKQEELKELQEARKNTKDKREEKKNLRRWTKKAKAEIKWNSRKVRCSKSNNF